MPNWCHNEVIVRGDEKTVQEFRKFVESSKTRFDFNNVIPMPKELDGTKAPCDSDDPKVQELISKYGYGDWYGWCIHNWGSKWNTRGKDVNVSDFDNGVLVYTFLTPWAAPSEIYDALRFKYPKLEVSWFAQIDEFSGYL